MVEQVKICIACGKNIGENSCIRCGSLVCDLCFSRERSLCANCIAGKT
ncbi:MAG: hypothetical protein ABIB47_04720 [Candidatus Woesearchaeota archaeon]